MTPRYRPRPTTYKGIPMRSRLEAGFAQWLDECEYDAWFYEPQAFADETGQYLPDFHVPDPFDHDYFYEVKPASISPAGVLRALSTMHIIRSSLPDVYLEVSVGQWVGGGFDFDVAAGCYHADCRRCPVGARRTA